MSTLCQKVRLLRMNRKIPSGDTRYLGSPDVFFRVKTTGKISLFLCQLTEGLLSKSLKLLGMEMPVFT
jgi:hypothetical protein